jgi:hypothetical protein
MLRSDWGKRVKAGLKFGLPIAILSLGFIAWGLSESAKYQGEANNHARQYAEHARDKVEQSCIGFAPLEKRECINEAREKQRAGERDEQDLVAQRQSALWAYIMGAAAVIGMGLSAVGVYLVWTTFAETRIANEIAREGTKLAQANLDMGRPFILFIGFESAMCANSQGDQYWTFIFKWKNFGQIPASIQQGSIRRVVLSHGMFATNEVEEFEIPSDPIEMVSKDFMAKDITQEFSIIVSDLEIYTDQGKRAALPGTVSVISRVSYRNPIDMFAGPYVSQYAINFSFVMPGDGERGVKGHRELPDLIYNT